MSDENMRAEFEAWLVSFLSDAEIYDVSNARSADTDGTTVYRFPDDDEATMGITAMWLGWQASRAALVVELPDEYDDEWLNLDEVKQAIEAAGVRVKP